jgi:hypothetical protein
LLNIFSYYLNFTLRSLSFFSSADLYPTMTKSLFAIALLAYFGLASPVPEADPEPQISLPPLIPSIPGVTEPLASNAPPLPILQLPTPPLESPPFTGSDLTPKKIGYFWTGAGDNIHAGE